VPEGSTGDGRKSICRACDRVKAKAYYQANREKVLARQSARYEELTTCPNTSGA